MLLNCGVGKDSWESLGLQGDPTSPSWRRSVLGVFIGRTDVEAETPVLDPPDVKSWLTWKDSDAGKDWGQEEKRTTENEMVGWHHWLNGHGFGWTPGVGDGQGGLACCDSWGRRVGYDRVTELNWTDGISAWIIWGYLGYSDCKWWKIRLFTNGKACDRGLRVWLDNFR